MAEQKLGKIDKAYLGKGGYQDAMFGLTLVFETDGGSGGCQTFEGAWSMPPSASAEWTVADQSGHFDKVMRLIMATLKDAKKDTLDKLAGTPVMLTFESPIGRLESWRVLKEVL